MSHSHKNKSMGGHGKGDSGADFMPIRNNVDPKPPAGESNSYEKVRKNLDSKDRSSLGKGHYSREKMMNK